MKFYRLSDATFYYRINTIYQFFFFFFDLGFTALSRIFHLYRADRSSKVGENRRTRRIVCVEVLWPSQPNGVMSSVVSLPNHTFTGQA